MHCVAQPVPNYRRAGLHAITALLTCPSPKTFVASFGSQTSAYTSCWHWWYMAARMKSPKGRNAQKEVREGHSRVVHFWDFLLAFSINSTSLFYSLHYLFDFTYSFSFIIHLSLWYSLSQGRTHGSCTWMIHVPPYSQSSKFLQLKQSDNVLREKRPPDIRIRMRLKHQHVCNHLSRWHKEVYLCPFCFDKEISIISHYEVFHSFIEEHTEMYVIIYKFQLPHIKGHITYIWQQENNQSC